MREKNCKIVDARSKDITKESIMGRLEKVLKEGKFKHLFNCMPPDINVPKSWVFIHETLFQNPRFRSMFDRYLQKWKSLKVMPPSWKKVIELLTFMYDFLSQKTRQWQNTEEKDAFFKQLCYLELCADIRQWKFCIEKLTWNHAKTVEFKRFLTDWGYSV